MNEHLRTALAAMWTAIRGRHPEVPEVAIVFGDPSGLSRDLFPLTMAARCSCGLGRVLRADSRTIADAPPQCPVCDRPYRPFYFNEL